MKRRTIVLFAMLAAACRGSVENPARARASSRPVRLQGDTIAYRFTDHAREARVSTPDLTACWESWTYPAKLPSPYSRLGGEAALRVVEVALTDTDVADFGRPHKAVSQELRFDPVWNRTRAVYDSKTSLFAPTPSRYRFSTGIVKHARLRTAIAVAPGGSAAGPIEFTVEVNGKPVAQRTLSEVGEWVELDVEIENAREVSLATRGGEGAPALFGNPLLLARDGGAPGPNLLLIIIDTLRADALAVMPRLQQLASTGVSFEQAITAATWTRPSLLALLGGKLPTALGQSAEEMIPPDVERRRFYASAPALLPRLLQGEGWTSAAIGNNFFLLGYPQIGLSLGFETVADVRHPVLDTPAIARAAEAFIAAHARESWFLQVHFDGPHWPYTPPPEQLNRVRVPAGFPTDPMARAYLAEAAYSDEYLGQVLDALARAGLRERTIVVVVGDHGEVFDQAHAHTVEAMRQSTLHHHGWAAYDEIVRVPLVMARPGLLPVEKIDTQVSLIDVQPTLLELLGVARRSDQSLAPLWLHERREDRPAFIEGQNVRALRDAGWLYLVRKDGRLLFPDGRARRVDEELYDLSRDPEQHQNLVEARPNELARMRARMKELAPVPPEGPTGTVHLRLEPDGRLHALEAVLTSEGRVVVRGAHNAEAKIDDAHRVTASLQSAGQLDLAIDPPDAAFTLAIKRDGVALMGAQLLVGAFALPLLGGGTPIHVDGERLRWLESARPPPRGERGDVILWRDPARMSIVPAAGREANSEVGNIMRRWGYAQPGK